MKKYRGVALQESKNGAMGVEVVSNRVFDVQSVDNFAVFTTQKEVSDMLK